MFLLCFFGGGEPRSISRSVINAAGVCVCHLAGRSGSGVPGGILRAPKAQGPRPGALGLGPAGRFAS